MAYFMDEEEAKKEQAMNYVFVDEEKSVIPVSEEKASSAGDPLAIVKEIADPAAKKDVMYAEIETEKRLALIKAWEESEKTKAENRAHKRMSAVGLMGRQLENIRHNSEKLRRSLKEIRQNMLRK